MKVLNSIVKNSEGKSCRGEGTKRIAQKTLGMKK